ncbi:MAG: helix-turn-helix domain-containing protein [Gammaproteobacteria bacterium]
MRDPASIPDTSSRAAAGRVDPGRVRCSSCAILSRCLPASLDAAQIHGFEESIQRSRLLGAGDHLFRTGDPFHALFAVQSGCFKSYMVDAEGREHVLAFHFVGEIIGVDAIYPERHVSSCVGLAEQNSVCVLPYRSLTRLSQEMPQLQSGLLRMMSRYVLGGTTIAGDFTAEERLAAFLVMVAARLRRPGGWSGELDLAMSRQDIANFLRLAPETVSRILARFQKAGLVKADRKRIALLNPDGLSEIAACMNPYTRFGP